MLNKNRKGVSEVVANVLIVLLVIVGIAVIWSVVKPTIDKASDTVQSDCFTVQVEPQSCADATPLVAGATGASTVTLKRNPGAGNFENVEFIFKDASGDTQRVPASPVVTQTSIDELETLAVSVSVPAVTTGVPFDGIAVNANIVLKVNGQLCQVTTQPVPCN